MRFRNCFATSSICAVSRACILTGQHVARHRISDFHQALEATQLQSTYPAVLRRHGYYTGFIGKWGVGHDVPSAQRAAQEFDYWAGAPGQMHYWYEADSPFVAGDGPENVDPRPEHATGSAPPDPHSMRRPKHLTLDVIPQKFDEFLDRRPSDAPFCVSISFKAPHGPFEGLPPEVAALYDGRSFPESPTATEAHAAARPPQFGAMLSASLGSRFARNPGQRADMLRRYYGLVTALDLAVGKIVAALRARGLEQDTVVLFTSDNGLLIGEHGLSGKWLMRDPSIRVPGFVFDPRLPEPARGGFLERAVLGIDFAPTLLRLAGASIPDSMQGEVIPFAGPSGPVGEVGRPWLYDQPFTADGRIPAARGVHDGRFAFARYDSGGAVFEELFDLQADPHECRNLAGDPRAEAELCRMRGLLDALSAAAR